MKVILLLLLISLSFCDSELCGGNAKSYDDCKDLLAVTEGSVCCFMHVKGKDEMGISYDMNYCIEENKETYESTLKDHTTDEGEFELKCNFEDTKVNQSQNNITDDSSNSAFIKFKGLFLFLFLFL